MVIVGRNTAISCRPTLKVSSTVETSVWFGRMTLMKILNAGVDIEKISA